VQQTEYPDKKHEINTDNFHNKAYFDSVQTVPFHENIPSKSFEYLNAILNFLMILHFLMTDVITQIKSKHEFPKNNSREKLIKSIE
jgi:hypothetical protein